MERVEDSLRGLGITPADSQTNFLWLDLPQDGPEEADVVQALAARGVLVRSGAALGRAGALRVTVGLEGENERFLAELAALLGARV